MKITFNIRAGAILRSVLLLAGLTLIAGMLMSGQPSGMNSFEAGRPGQLQSLRSHGNALRDQPSLYLQQHARNPIDWQPWGDEALSRSRRENKPVFLSIGYSSCHWCHVMEREVFEHDDVAIFMNRHFICIKVDREERPDLDAVYMDAVVAMTGRGGWPMSVFLTSDLQPFYGGTYFPHDAFMQLVTQIEAVWREQSESVHRQGAAVAQRIADRVAPGVDGRIDDALLARVTRQTLDYVDPTWGGFRQQQKFPTPVRWRFLLHRYRVEMNEKPQRYLRRTLDMIDSGGIHDQVGGGFHRYTVEQTWLVPHFEIMLYDNAQLATLYLEAAAVLDEPRYMQAGCGVLDFLVRDMTAPAGGIHASFDADSGGEEGSFYVWTPEEINAVAGDEDGPLLAQLLGVTRAGNFEGKSILTRRADLRELAQTSGRGLDGISGLFDRYREALYQYRQHRVAPTLDRKIVTAWNGLALGAFARGYAATGRPDYLKAAEGIVDYLWSHHRDGDDHLFRASTDGRAGGSGILDDYAFLADGLLELFQATGELSYFDKAEILMASAVARFEDPEGGFFLTAVEVAAPLGRRHEIYDNVEPSGESMMVQVMIRLAALKGDAHLYERAGVIIGRYADQFREAPLEMTWWADAAALCMGDYFDVVIAGDPDAGDTRLLNDAFRGAQPVNAVLVAVPARGPDPAQLKRLPSLAGKIAVDGRATAYVCRFGACREPVHSAAEMLEQIGPRR